MDEIMQSTPLKMEYGRAFLGGTPGDSAGGYADGLLTLTKKHLLFVPRGHGLLLGSMRLGGTIVSLVALLALVAAMSSVLGFAGFVLALVIYYAAWKTVLKGVIGSIFSRAFDVREQLSSEKGRLIRREHILKVEKSPGREKGPNFIHVHFRKGDAKDKLSFVFGTERKGYGEEAPVNSFMSVLAGESAEAAEAAKADAKPAAGADPGKN